MADYTETELRNLHAVRRFLNEEPPPDDKSELFAEDGIWWNGLPLAHRDGGTEHRGRDAIRKLLPSQNTNAPLDVIGNPGETPVGRSFDCLYLLQCCVLQISLTHPAKSRLIIGQKCLIGLEIKQFSSVGILFGNLGGLRKSL